MMRAAQVRVMPGTLSNSSMVAVLMSMRISGSGAARRVRGDSATNPTSARALTVPSVSTTKTKKDFTFLFCACGPVGHQLWAHWT